MALYGRYSECSDLCCGQERMVLPSNSCYPFRFYQYRTMPGVTVALIESAAPPESLVKYEAPEAVKTKTHKLLFQAGADQNLWAGSGQLRGLQTTSLLNTLLPPRQWTQDGHLWIQSVSSSPATRAEVQDLLQRFTEELQIRQARPVGICPIRRELYSQCFDELIRQVAITCAEQGHLLHRIRDELRMTLRSYETMYESSVGFGLRRSLHGEQGRQDAAAQLQQADAMQTALQQQVEEWQARCNATEKQQEEERTAAAQKHQEEVDFLEEQVKQLQKQLDDVLANSQKK
ncbi:hypothetical protein WJX84_001202 [Apatococcus fuscideae]|uniref:Axonemal dynein light intermediate polypeptide 1 n=1 Tax=Apatococcus fuscideae TaxID=2026836 RepID=A0AAW1RIC3_9CHLO